MKSKRSNKKEHESSSSVVSLPYSGDEIIPLKECKKYLQKYNLSDERIREIRNSLIGLVDGIINSYLDSF